MSIPPSQEIPYAPPQILEELEKLHRHVHSKRLGSTAEFWSELGRALGAPFEISARETGMGIPADLGVTVPALSALNKGAIHAPSQKCSATVEFAENRLFSYQR